jgi:hypothetical protein
MNPSRVFKIESARHGHSSWSWLEHQKMDSVKILQQTILIPNV